MPKDYYKLLGVAPNASLSEIKQAYKTRIKENHPDQFKGTKAKYMAANNAQDKTVLELLDEKIRKAEELSKDLNEAYATLSDSHARQRYDANAPASSPPPASSRAPALRFSKNSINFGKIAVGGKRELKFTIDSVGAPIQDINFDWRQKPRWAEMDIIAHPDNGFPIQIVIKAEDVASLNGLFETSIMITADGSLFEIPVSIELPKATTTATGGTTAKGSTSGSTAAKKPTAGGTTRRKTAKPVKKRNRWPAYVLALLGMLPYFGVVSFFGPVAFWLLLAAWLMIALDYSATEVLKFSVVLAVISLFGGLGIIPALGAYSFWLIMAAIGLLIFADSP